MQTTYIFGHKIPDTDSVCASISLSYLKNHLGEDTEPRVLGNINNETKFVLDYFNVKTPKYLNDVRIQIKDVDYDKKCFLNENDSIFNGYRHMKETKVSTIPVIDDEGNYKGAVSMKGVAGNLISGKMTWLHTSYDNLLEALDAEEILRFDKEIEGNIYSPSYRSATFKEQVQIDKDSVLIIGDRHSIIEYAVNNSASIIILTNGVEMKPEHLEIAKKNHVDVISTKYDGLTTSNLVVLSNYIKDKIKDEDIICVNENDSLYDVLEMANKKQYSNYPILNNSGKCLGIFRVSTAENNTPKKVILVDHNEFPQSVDGIEKAKIRMVVDHHRICDFLTAEPLYYRAEPVGCTNTILLKMYKEYGFEIDKKIAGIMLSAIISDTLLLKSPTKTVEDEKAVEELAKIAEVNYEEYGLEMLKAGTDLSDYSAEELIGLDCKKCELKDKKAKVAQVNTADISEMMKRKSEFEAAISKDIEENNLDLFVFAITDIINSNSQAIVLGKETTIFEKGFNTKLEDNTAFLPGVVSRKKQILPVLQENA